MPQARDIISHAKSLFDVTSVAEYEGDCLLILGLESTSERNLDEFGHEDGIYRLYGFEAHIVPRLNDLIGCINLHGFSAEPLGRLGYPLKGEVNLKAMAIRTGIGARGKSSIVLHPSYGPRLRFIGLRTDAPFKLSEPREERESPFCKDCAVCLDVCPINVLSAYQMTDPAPCLSNITRVNKKGRSILCDECLIKCPANSR